MRRAFTLIELMIVMAIMAIILAIAVNNKFRSETPPEGPTLDQVYIIRSADGTQIQVRARLEGNVLVLLDQSVVEDGW